MKLYIVRHADAAGGPIDAERPLSEKGQRDVQRMAALLGRAGCQVARVLHSPRVRARDTATALAQVVDPGAAPEAIAQGINPDDSPQGVAEAAAAWHEDVMLVSHQPFVGRLVALLTAGDETAGVADLATGAVACLERDDSGGWSMLWLATPALLGP